MLPFVKPHDLKLQLNEQWGLIHERLARRLTLSKIRSVKRDMLALAQAGSPPRAIAEITAERGDCAEQYVCAL